MAFRYVIAAYCWLVTCVITFIASMTIVSSLLLPSFLRRPIIRHTPFIWGRSLVWGNWGRLLVIHTAPTHIGPALYMSNHLSQSDIPVLLGSLPRGLCFISKKEVFAIPVMGWAMRGLNYISVDRGSRHQAIRSIEKAGERIRNEGLSVWISPEGTRSPDGKLGPFKKGPFHLALQARVPIIPVYLQGTNHVLPKKKLMPTPRAPMTLVIDRPLPVPPEGEVDSDGLLLQCRERLLHLERTCREMLATNPNLQHPMVGVREVSVSVAPEV